VKNIFLSLIHYFKNNKKGMSLIEILVVLIVVGLLASLTFPGYVKMKEGAIDREVKTALKLIQSAQKIYRLSKPHYYGNLGSCAKGNDYTDNINTKLHLDLSNSNWTYCVETDTANYSDYQAEAYRMAGSDRTWRIGSHDENAGCVDGNCIPGS